MDASTEATGSEVPLEHLEHEICQLSAHLAAAMCRWLELVAEFDRREGWGHQGAKSCAQWLSWRCGTRPATGHLHWFWDDDGSLVITTRLDADEGALVLQALDAGDHALRDQAARGRLSTEIDDAAASSGPAVASTDDTVTDARRHNAEAARVPFTRADALVAMAETMLAHGPTARDGGERYQVVVTVANDTLPASPAVPRSMAARSCSPRRLGAWRVTPPWWP